MAGREGVALAACTATVAIAAMAGCGGGSSGVAKSGSITVVRTIALSGKASVVVTGFITDTGRSFPADAHGTANPKDNYQEAVLGHGTFLLDENALNAARPKGGLNRSTCLLALTFKAAVPVLLGTGMYAGIRGSLQGVAEVRYHVPRYSSGKRRGECNPLAKPPPGVYSATMTGRGSVTY
jgi:hypothetical protein